MFTPDFKYYVQNTGNGNRFIDQEGEVISSYNALPNGNYQFNQWGHEIAFSITGNEIIKSWVSPRREFYKQLDNLGVLSKDNVETIRKLLEIRFQDERRSEAYVTKFFEGKDVVEVVVSANSQATVKVTPEEIDGMTKDEAIRYAFAQGLGDYITFSWTSEKIKEAIKEHLDISL